MASKMQDKNQDISNSIDTLTVNYQERFQAYVSALKALVSSTSRENAQQIFCSALPVLSYMFPDPTENTSDTIETCDLQQEVDSLKAELTKMKKHLDDQLQEGMKTVKQETLNECCCVLQARIDAAVSSKKNLEKRIARAESKNEQLTRDLTDLKNTFESKVTERLDELSLRTKTSEQNVMGLRKLQNILNQRIQVSQAVAITAAATAAQSTPGTTATTTTSKSLSASAIPTAIPPSLSRTPRTLNLRTSFSTHHESSGGGCYTCIRDVKLLPGGKILLIKVYSHRVMLYTTQGQHLDTHICLSAPYRLTVMNTEQGTSKVAVVCDDKTIQFLEIGQKHITHKSTIQTDKQYDTIAAIDRETLAAGGYNYGSGIDLIDMTGKVLRQITLRINPEYMMVTTDGDLVCSTVDETIARLKVTTGQVIHNTKVSQINHPLGISENQDGSLFVIDRDTSTLHLVTPQGAWVKHLWTVPGGMSRDASLWNVSQDNHVCVCTTLKGSAYVLDVMY